MEILYAGVDTLDLAIMGAFPQHTLDALEEAKETQKDCTTHIGKGNVRVSVKTHGQRGGYRYVFTNGETGAIFSVKANNDLKEWNLFVSIRSLRLLISGYAGTKAWLFDQLEDMGFRTTQISVNRIDYAIDIRTYGFKPDMQNFVSPGQAKARSHFDTGNILDDMGEVIRTVSRARNLESTTIGSMPNRQVILYNKLREVKDRNRFYMFDQWGVDKDDPTREVWRIEIRAGREALTKWIKKLNTGVDRRSFEKVEVSIRDYLIKALTDIRYVQEIDQHSNISRAPLHPIWELATDHVQTLPLMSKPKLEEDRIIEIIRLQLMELLLKQIGGLSVRYAELSERTISAKEFPDFCSELGQKYRTIMGEKVISNKLETVNIG